MVKAYRLGSPSGNHPVYSTGRAEGRWNREGAPIMYASLAFSTAVLETLVHLGVHPKEGQQRYVVINIPDGLIDCLPDDLIDCGPRKGLPPDREAEYYEVARDFVDQWLVEETSKPVLGVPSVLSPSDDNLMIHIEHPDFEKIRPGKEELYKWDPRLFSYEEERSEEDGSR